ncbi:hypothetical protein GCM10023187_34930 [Nibrella viscosa]|uniref:Uncharacterized protein n=1 Tax=Nibrella viscosa TaxID=1084524 RepID=A0ABP8KLZ3_9BACT
MFGLSVEDNKDLYEVCNHIGNLKHTMSTRAFTRSLQIVFALSLVGQRIEVIRKLFGK